MTRKHVRSFSAQKLKLASATSDTVKCAECKSNVRELRMKRLLVFFPVASIFQKCGKYFQYLYPRPLHLGTAVKGVVPRGILISSYLRNFSGILQWNFFVVNSSLYRMYEDASVTFYVVTPGKYSGAVLLGRACRVPWTSKKFQSIFDQIFASKTWVQLSGQNCGRLTQNTFKHNFIAPKALFVQVPNHTIGIDFRVSRGLRFTEGLWARGWSMWTRRRTLKI